MFVGFVFDQADVYTHTAYSALGRTTDEHFTNEGIPLVQQRQNTMFRWIKKKLETLLKQRTSEKHFGYI